MSININFTAPPTVAAFMRSEAFFRLIAGPVGSGKTAGCIMELLRRSVEQAPGQDGLRHTRFAIVRQTLKQLKDTVLKDIETWLTGLVHYKVQDQTVFVSFGDVRSEWLLIPLDEPEDQRRLLSMQLTGAWLSEAIEINSDVVPSVLGRCGRYPSRAMMPEGHTGPWPTWHGALADTNFPTEGDPWHNLMELATPPEWQVFKQPGGLEKNAENIENLPGGRLYYERLSKGNNQDWVQRYVHAQYGNDPSGQAVFRSTFKREFHTVKLDDEARAAGHQYALNPSPGNPIIVVQDFGRNPSSLICQQDYKGRALVLEELVAEDVGLEMHLKQTLMPRLSSARYLGRATYMIGDPSGIARSSVYEETSFDVVKRAGMNAFPAPTNALDKRLRAVEALLLQQRDGGAALLIDADMCPKLVLAMQGRYRYAKRRNGQLAPQPEKFHPWSDLADDLQYFCLIIQGGMSGYVANRLAHQRERSMNPPARQRMSAAGWT